MEHDKDSEKVANISIQDEIFRIIGRLHTERKSECILQLTNELTALFDSEIGKVYDKNFHLYMENVRLESRLYEKQLEGGKP